MFMGKTEKFVATRPMARPIRGFFAARLYALTLARRIRVS
jgi:hypothetical protein